MLIFFENRAIGNCARQQVLLHAVRPPQTKRYKLIEIGDAMELS